MSVYVDPLFTAVSTNHQAQRHGNQWCHMVCDGDLEELHQMAEKIGLKRSYFQSPPKASMPHYDLTPVKRSMAVKNGAIEASFKELTPIRRFWMFGEPFDRSTLQASVCQTGIPGV